MKSMRIKFYLKVTVCTAFVAVLLVVSALAVLWFRSDPRKAFMRHELAVVPHRIFKDRFGTMLRFPLNADEERLIWVKESDVPAHVKNAFLAAEDARFYEHQGFDIKAIARAFIDNTKNWRIVSGASTISQQVIRIVSPRVRRSYPNKLREVLLSIRMENELTKDEILEQYLNRVPMGNQLRGIEAASMRYFGKNCVDLTLSEAAILAAIPKAPSRYNPYTKHNDRLKHRRDWVLKRMKDVGFITASQYEDAVKSVLSYKREPFPMKAGHLIEMLLRDDDLKVGDVVTTIDINLQNDIEEILRSHRYKLIKSGASQASALIVDNSTMDVLALVGSMEYGGDDLGYNNGALALRSAGSTLKPFLYALAFEKGYTPASVIADTEKSYPSPTGGYMPFNYDKRFYGPVSIRTALGNSLNISAVKLLNAVGLNDFYKRLNDLSLVSDLEKDASHYGIGLAIGNMEVSLKTLVAGYASLANKGYFRPLRFIKDEPIESAKRVMSPEVTYLITDILSDPNARTLTFGTRDLYNVPYRLALKTGTSTYYRDAWVVGYTSDYTVGVWVGNFDGRPTYGMSGAAAATPILRDIMNQLYKQNYPIEPEMPENIVRAKICSQSGMQPGRWCRGIKGELFIKGTEPNKKCTEHKSKENVRSISTRYAKWLYDKKVRGIEGSFRLEDYSSDLDQVFADPWDVFQGRKRVTSIRVAGIESLGKTDGDYGDYGENVYGTESYGTKSYGTKLPGGKEHYTIGAKRKAGPSMKGGTTIPTIIYPLPDDRFVVGSDTGANYISMQAQSDSAVEYLVWFIDGVEYAKTPPPFIMYYKPSRGEHSLSVLNPAGLGSSINIFVE